MEYVWLYTDYDQDPAVVAAGEAAELLFVRGIAYAGRAESKGFIPDGQLPRMCPKGWKQRASALVRVGLWVRDDERDGYQIRSWEKLQRQHDALAQRRRADRERKAKSRDRSRDSHVTVTESDEGAVTKKDARSGQYTRPFYDETNPETDHSVTDRTSPTSGNAEMSRGQSRDLSRDVRTTEERRGEKNSVTSASTSRSVPAEPPADTTPGIAEQILRAHLDACERTPPAANTAALGKQISALIQEGVAPNDVSRGVAAWRGKGLHPSQLPHVVAEVQNRPAGLAVRGGTNGQPVSTTDQRVAAGLALAQRYREEDQ